MFRVTVEGRPAREFMVTSHHGERGRGESPLTEHAGTFKTAEEARAWVRDRIMEIAGLIPKAVAMDSFMRLVAGVRVGIAPRERRGVEVTGALLRGVVWRLVTVPGEGLRWRCVHESNEGDGVRRINNARQV